MNDAKVEASVYVGLWENGFKLGFQYYNKDPLSPMPSADEWEKANNAWRQGWMTGLRVGKQLANSKGV